MNSPPIRYSTNLEGSFDLYGLSFRWFGPARVHHKVPGGVIPLFRERRPLATNAVKWLLPGDPATSTPWVGMLDEDYVYRFDDLADFRMPRDARHLLVYIHPQARHVDVN